MPGTVPPQSIHIRKADPKDAAEIALLGHQIFTTTFGHSVPPNELKTYLDESYTTAAITKDIQDPLKDLIIASSQEGIIVGFAYLTRGTTDPCIAHVQNAVELQRIYIHVEHHSQGIGRLLAEKIEDMAREQRFEYIWLGVWEENHKARKVYEKMGYSIVGMHDFMIGEVLQTDHIMLKKL